MNEALGKNLRRERRALRVRSKLRRTGDAPRLSVSRSVKHIQAQIIDDASGRTLAHVSTTAKSLAGDLKGKKKTERAAFVGSELAKRAKAAGVERVVFDRGAARYHGRIKALAEAARAGGLKF
ncbi:MAG: 50S ribosomal protein L18 [Planctomycetes bacterium]|nr:50S ribosomal protein L18 [Planctomycetota bacterium]